MSIAENIQAIRARMDRAARAAGRDPAEILLVGASKMNGAAACRAAIAAGIDALGENRVQEIQRQAEKLDVVQDVLLEVNIGGEESKGGFAPEELYAAAETAGGFPNVRVLGLMTIPPVEREPHGNFPYFLKVSQLYVDISRNLYDNSFKYLSMGMSDDFEDAIAAGATMIRVGSAIFGHRQYQ